MRGRRGGERASRARRRRCEVNEGGGWTGEGDLVVGSLSRCRNRHEEEEAEGEGWVRTSPSHEVGAKDEGKGASSSRPRCCVVGEDEGGGEDEGEGEDEARPRPCCVVAPWVSTRERARARARRRIVTSSSLSSPLRGGA